MVWFDWKLTIELDGSGGLFIRFSGMPAVGAEYYPNRFYGALVQQSEEVFLQFLPLNFALVSKWLIRNLGGR